MELNFNDSNYNINNNINNIYICIMELNFNDSNYNIIISNNNNKFVLWN